MIIGLFGAIARLLPNPVLLCGADGRILAANPAAGRCDDRLRSGTSLLDLETENVPLLVRHLATWLRSGDPLPGALAIKDGDGCLRRFRCHGARARWWDGPRPAIQLHLVPLDASDQFVMLSQQVAALNREVTYRRSAEAERARLLAAEQAARTQLQHLYALTAALTGTVTVSQVCQAVTHAAPAALGATAVELHLHSTRLIPPLYPGERMAPAAAEGWTDLDNHAPPIAPGQGPGPPASPLEADGVELGMMVVHGAGTTTGPEHANAVAQQIAQALRRAGLHEHEHRVAGRLQLSLLPHLPDLTGLEAATCYAPGSDLLYVGGDWYDAYRIDADHIGLSIGDIAGHGLPQAALMAQVTAALRSIVLRSGTRPADVLDELNTFLGLYHPDQMATACYLVFNHRTRTLAYASAGHPPPLLIHCDGASTYLNRATVPPLGPVHGVRYRQADITLAKDDTLLLYTDGLIERRREEITLGLERLTALASTTTGLGIAELCDRFLHHQPDAASTDDRALLAARFPAPA